MRLVDQIYVIRDTETGKLVAINNKSGWCSVGAAKTAWMCGGYFEIKRLGIKKFDEQAKYVVEALS